MYLIINKWVIAVKVSNFSGRYLRNHRTLDMGVLGYIGIVWPKEHSPEVWPVPPVTSCIYIYYKDLLIRVKKRNGIMVTSCGRFTRGPTDREERIAVRKQCASAIRNSERSIQTLTVAQKRKAPLYWDVHIESPPVSFSLFYTLPLILSEPLPSYTEHKINPTCPLDHTRYPTFRIGTAFRPSATQKLARLETALMFPVLA